MTVDEDRFKETFIATFMAIQIEKQYSDISLTRLDYPAEDAMYLAEEAYEQLMETIRVCG